MTFQKLCCVTRLLNPLFVFELLLSLKEKLELEEANQNGFHLSSRIRRDERRRDHGRDERVAGYMEPSHGGHGSPG